MAGFQPTLFDCEEWKPALGWEKLYEVSNQGRVRSLDRIVLRKDGFQRISRGRILKLYKSKWGYLYVDFHDGGRRQKTAVHRLVLESFANPSPEGTECCHWNGDREDNRLPNLRWANRSENVYDMVRMGRHNNARKTHCSNGHELTTENIYRSPSKPNNRQCRTCRSEDSRRRKARGRLSK